MGGWRLSVAKPQVATDWGTASLCLVMPLLMDTKIQQGDAETFGWIMLATYGGMGAVNLLAGLLHAYAGYRNYQFKGRTLGIVALAAGMITIGGCYCLPTAVALAIYGLIVLLNSSVTEAFRMGEQGYDGDAILLTFSRYRMSFPQPPDAGQGRQISFQCPHCGVRTQVAGQFAGQTGPCRQCGQTVTLPHPGDALDPGVQAPRTHGVACPRCGGQSNGPGPWPWYLGTIGAIFVSARLCNLCGHEFDARKPQADFAKRKFNLALLINGFGGLGIVTIVVLLGWLIYVTMK